MRVRIHRGAHEVGGSCVEIESADGSRVIVDLGRPLTAGPDDVVPLPPIRGLVEPDASLVGIVISHPHLDHYGLLVDVDPRVPVFIGREAAAVLQAAAFFSPITTSVVPAGHLADREPFTLGPFSITPYLADHSAFDSYSLLIEVDGTRVFYTGDFRGHGRKASLFERLIADPPRGIDVVLCEGTSVRPDPSGDDAEFSTESELEDELVSLARSRDGAIAVFGSAQNLDRIVTAYRAARRSGRELVLDLYGATVAAATRTTIPQPGFDGLRVYVPQRQRALVKTSGEFRRVAAIRPHRIFAEQLAADPSRYLLHVPSSTASELLRAGVLTTSSLALWSMWDGYLTQPSGLGVTARLQAVGVPFRSLHTSGHASVLDLRRLLRALAPAAVVPIHTESPQRFTALFANVQPHADSTWWAA